MSSVFGSAVRAGIACMVVALVATEGSAQSSSLFGDPGARRPLTLDRLSWTYQPVIEPRELRVNDLITVVVDEKAQVIAEGEVDRRKKADGKLTLQDWIALDGWGVEPDPQTAGDPTIAGAVENKYRAEAELDTREAMKLRIACTVVDVRPNGNVVLEGHRQIRVNNEVWEISLTGIIAPESVLPNNTVLSENVANLRVHKREAGHVRDGYRRGWLLRWLDMYQPF